MSEIWRLWWRMKAARWVDWVCGVWGVDVCWAGLAMWALGYEEWDWDLLRDDGSRCAREKGGCYCGKYHPGDGE